MPHHRLLLVLLAALFIAALAPAQDDPPQTGGGGEAAPSEADRAFVDLQKDFSLVFRSLQESNGVLDEDRPALLGFLGRVQAFAAQWPSHAGAVAMQLQLHRWLGEDERADELLERLVELAPENASIGLLWLRRLEQTAADDPDRLADARRMLFERFPDNGEVLAGWAEYLKGEARYEEAIDTLQGAELDPAEAPDAIYALADCLLAVHRFEDALTTIDSIPAPTLERNYRIKRQVDAQRPVIEEQIGLWGKEQEIRRAEAAADDLPRVQIHTSKGPIVVELFENEAPNTVANFIKLAEEGFWIQTKFHRYEPDFMIQGGDPNTKPDGTGRPGLGGPGYYIPDEHHAENRRNHFADSIAMAKRPDANSAGSQFYFNFRPTPWLNGKHTVFGRVLDGRDVVRTLRADDEITMVIVLRKRDHDYEPDTLPLNIIDATSSGPGGG